MPGFYPSSQKDGGGPYTDLSPPPNLALRYLLGSFSAAMATDYELISIPYEVTLVPM